MLDLVMAFREDALREGVATKIILGRVILSEAQVKAWLPWKSGTVDVLLDDFGGGGNGILTEDGRYEFDMAWLRCKVHSTWHGCVARSILHRILVHWI